MGICNMVCLVAEKMCGKKKVNQNGFDVHFHLIQLLGSVHVSC